MADLHVTADVHIDAPAAVVRRQFGDVAYHQRSAPHRGVEFTVTDDDGTVCTYEQTTALGPLRTRQHFRLERTADGPLVNEITSGLFAGGSITFDIIPVADQRATVTATVTGPLNGLMGFAAPLLRRATARSLAGALLEDKADIESGSYAETGER